LLFHTEFSNGIEVLNSAKPLCVLTCLKPPLYACYTQFDVEVLEV